MSGHTKTNKLVTKPDRKTKQITVSVYTMYIKVLISIVEISYCGTENQERKWLSTINRTNNSFNVQENIPIKVPQEKGMTPKENQIQKKLKPNIETVCHLKGQIYTFEWSKGKTKHGADSLILWCLIYGQSNRNAQSEVLIHFNFTMKTTKKNEFRLCHQRGVILWEKQS